MLRIQVYSSVFVQSASRPSTVRKQISVTMSGLMRVTPEMRFRNASWRMPKGDDLGFMVLSLGLRF